MDLDSLDDERHRKQQDINQIDQVIEGRKNSFHAKRQETDRTFGSS
jgi:molybdenum cofactor biosynthesis enzyme MoaA